MLKTLSFHSVKGGVGKSTLATLAAFGAAYRHPAERVVLIDMDLTGTSLADVLPIEAPSWAGGPVDLLARPAEFLTRAESLRALEARDDDGKKVVTVPVLNDYLLFASPDWDAETDIEASTLFWRVEGGPKNLFVIPSSALPIDLEATLPVIFDEDQSAYLESRLEYLLAALASEPTWVIFDVPPTIPGLSRAVLSLALRLGGDPPLPLAQGGFVTAPLDEVPIRWTAGLVATFDQQDRFALGRWVRKIKPSEEQLFQVILNRVAGHFQPGQLKDLWRSSPDPGERFDLEAEYPLLDDVLIIPEDAGLRFFAGAQSPPRTHVSIDALLALVDS